MAFPAGQRVGLNLSAPRYTGPGSHVPLNLGVGDDTEPPEPVFRGVRAGVGLSWSGAAPQLRRVSRVAWAQAPLARAGAVVPWGLTSRVHQGAGVPWSAPARYQTQRGMPWRSRLPLAARQGTLSWGSLPTVARNVGASWRSLGLVGASVSVNWRSAPLVARGVGDRWLASLRQCRRPAVLPWHAFAPLRQSWRLPWGLASRVPWLVRPPKPPIPPVDPVETFPRGDRVGLSLGCPTMHVRGVVPLNLGSLACYAVRPQHRTFIVRNSISVVRLPDRLPIHVDSVSAEEGVDSWGIAFTLSLTDPDQLTLLKPNADGPRAVEITVNGYVYTALMEDYSRRRSVGGEGALSVSIPISGRSRTALLAAPYAPARTKVVSAERSMAQLVDDELADTGYVATYDTVDWLVPPSAWYYDGTTPMEAISRLAEASGAVVQSDPEALALRVRPRYPASPWDWTTTTPDHEVQDDVVTEDSLQIRTAPVYDAVVVTGELQGKGVTAAVKRAGEAGTLFAPQASSPLINTEPAAAERARNILSDRGEQAAITLTLPLFPAPLAPGQTGRVRPLDLVRVLEAESTWHGLCTAARVDARLEGSPPALVVEQTITLERHYTDAD